jgi:hypothetical protein
MFGYVLIEKEMMVLKSECMRRWFSSEGYDNGEIMWRQEKKVGLLLPLRGEPLIMLFSSLDENQCLFLSLLNESHCLFSFRMETIILLL